MHIHEEIINKNEFEREHLPAFYLFNGGHNSRLSLAESGLEQ